MGLMEELEDTKKQLAELEEDQQEQQDEEQEDDQEEESEEEQNEDSDEDLEKEEKKEQTKEEAAAYARMRRELAAANKRIEELTAQKEQPKETHQEDAQAEQLPEIQELLQERKQKQAERSFVALEEDFKRNAPEDYEAISNGYKLSLYNSLRSLNPRDTHTQLLDKVKDVVLTKASHYYRQGLDPIEELYHEAKELGVQPFVQEQEERKPDLSKIAANRKRNSGMAGAKGRGGGTLTAQAASELTVAEWSKLSTEEKQRLLTSA